MGNSHSNKKEARYKGVKVPSEWHIQPNGFGYVPHVVRTAVPESPPPKPFQTEDEFCRLWFSWRKEFSNYINNGGSHRAGFRASADMLLNCLGPVGIQISKTFTFMDPSEKENLDVLLQRFDIHCLYGTRKKLPQENTYRYVKDLQETAKRYLPEEEEIARSKITLELNEWCILNGYPSTFLSSSKYAKLTLMEIANWWNIYERKVQYEKRHAELGSDMVIDCKDCGNDHPTNKCPAEGKLCTHCNEQNHLYKKCPKRYVTDCARCGDNHLVRHCSAYQEICSNCNRRGHFQRTCNSRPFECYFCLEKHAPNRSMCPAQGATCTVCHKKGHIAAKCHNRKR